MKNWLRALVLFWASAAAWPLPAPPTGHGLDLVVSILPLRYFAERVGGERVRVDVLVAPDRSPATYEPTPQQMSNLARAALYVRVGVPFETVWMERIRAANPAMEVIDLRQDVPLRRLDPDHDHGSPAGGLEDPHIWLAPPLAKIMSRQIRDALTRLDPDHADAYARNFDGLASDLDRLDNDIRARLRGARTTRFMVFHPSWGYFADTYGLEQIAVERGGKSPNARTLGNLIERAQTEGIRMVFVQKQFPRQDAQTIAHAINGKVVAIDPLAYDYLDNLRRVADAIAGAVQ